MNPENIIRLVEKYRDDRSKIIRILEDMQSTYGYLPEDALRIVARQTGHSLVDIYGVASFYSGFSITPRGNHKLSVCMGTACHVRGAPVIAQEFERLLGIKDGGTTRDKMFSYGHVKCVGACALGPIVVVDGDYHSNVSVNQVKRMLRQYREEKHDLRLTKDEKIFQVYVSCPRCNRSLMDKENTINGYPSIRVTISFLRKHGWLRLSSLYGDYTIQSEYEIPIETVVDFFCTHCHAELRSARICPRCNARMIPMFVRGGAMLQICSRRGCKEHMLDLSGINIE